MKLKLIILTSAIFLIISCKKEDSFGEQNTQQSAYAVTNGVYIVNEGNFNSGNSSISFLSFNPLRVDNNVFYNQNTRPLGDVAQHIAICNGSAYIAVNNSGKIEVVDLGDFASVATITGLNSPRYIQVINDSKAFVTELYSDSIAIIDLKTHSLKGKFYAGSPTNSILMSKGKVFAANWQGKNVVVADTSGNMIRNIDVCKEPNSMSIDKNGNVWVLSSGGWDNEERPALTVIDPISLEIVKVIEFPEVQSNPSRLKINGNQDTLYFLSEHVYKMSINDDIVPSNPIINGSGHLFYGLEVDPNSPKVYVTDAIDYSQSGFLYRYSNSGAKIDSFPVGVIPGEMAINQTYYNVSQSGN